MQQTQSASRMPHSRSAYLAKSVPRPISLSLVLRGPNSKNPPPQSHFWAMVTNSGTCVCGYHILLGSLAA